MYPEEIMQAIIVPAIDELNLSLPDENQIEEGGELFDGNSDNAERVERLLLLVEERIRENCGEELLLLGPGEEARSPVVKNRFRSVYDLARYISWLM